MTNDLKYVDVHVGKQIRKTRKERGITQMTIAEYCGITFQQIQKYENGKNRVSASRLAQISRLMGKPVQDFFPACFTKG